MYNTKDPSVTHCKRLLSAFKHSETTSEGLSKSHEAKLYIRNEKHVVTIWGGSVTETFVAVWNITFRIHRSGMGFFYHITLGVQFFVNICQLSSCRVPGYGLFKEVKICANLRMVATPEAFGSVSL